jgi:hypothetical protein
MNNLSEKRQQDLQRCDKDFKENKSIHKQIKMATKWMLFFISKATAVAVETV